MAGARPGQRAATDRPAAHPNPGGCAFGPPKSKRSERTIALDPATVEALRHHREVQQLERDLAGDAYEDQDPVFCNELGG